MKVILQKMVPRSVKKITRLLLLRIRYPGRTILTPHVHRSVTLGIKCKLLTDVEVGENVDIGNYSYVNKGSVIASGRIGKFCSIGYYCQIGMHEHPTALLSTSPYLYGIHNILGIKQSWNDFVSPPSIGNDVWIGSNSVILQGVTIGDGAIIAAGAVVTKDVSPYTIVAGVPAKMIKKRFSDKKIDDLQQLQWWNKPISEIKTIFTQFTQDEITRE